MKFRVVILGVLIIGMVILGGCQQAKTTPASEDASNAPAASGGTPGAMPNRELDTLNRLAFGTLALEGTGNAVTAEQAKDLLPLWQMIQSGSLKSDAENEAVVKQIENQMTEAQIAAMEGLTFEDMRAWMEEQGIEMAVPGDPAQGSQMPGDLQNMTEEERTQMREKFQNMTEEERATAMAEQGFQPPAGGGRGDFQPPASDGQSPASGGRPGGGGMRGGNVLLEPLITLLTERAASQ
ncbi:MAG: hypothetical protein JXA21_00930 [Anaerolineae bacterium]|nr:hypothetical protein [Anaerolineae bacterium]